MHTTREKINWCFDHVFNKISSTAACVFSRMSYQDWQSSTLHEGSLFFELAFRLSVGKIRKLNCCDAVKLPWSRTTLILFCLRI